jgi:GNAT superfamily N-acetyltransferase
MGTPFHIAAATPADAATLAAFRLAMFRSMNPDVDYEPIETDFLRASAKYYARNTAASGEHSVIARADDVVVGSGTIMFQERPPHVRRLHNLSAYILSVYVKPEHRGKGAATGIMEALLDEARRRGVFRVALHASSLGRPIYERLGFCPKENYLEMELDS